MVPIKGKSRVGSARVSEGGQSRRSAGGSNFRVYSENEQLKVGDGLKKVEKEVGVTSRRSATLANKGVIPNSVSSPKGGLKNVEKSSGEYGTSANINVRKALTDVSNVQAKSANNFGRGSKMKVSAVSRIKIVGVSSRKPLTGRVEGNISQGDKLLDASNRVGRDLRASLDDQKNNTDGGQSTVVTKDRIARKPTLPTTTRKSLPLPRKVNTAAMINTKENAGCSGMEKGQSGLPSKKL